jgi:Fe-S cluster assembly protein SufB
VDLHVLSLDAVLPTFGQVIGRPRHEGPLSVSAAQAFNRLRRTVSESPDGALVSAGALDDAEALYRAVRERLAEQGVIFTTIVEAMHGHPALLEQYYGSVVSASDSLFAALNAALWTDGVLVYVPAGVAVEVPLQGDYLGIGIDAPFTRTLVIAEQGSSVQLLEGCAAPVYTPDVLRASVVEVVVRAGARVMYTTLQNWSANVLNMPSKAAAVDDRGSMEWLEVNLGSRMTGLHPRAILKGAGARSEVVSIAFAGEGQRQDVGADVIIEGQDASGSATSRVLLMDGGQADAGVTLGDGMDVSHQALRLYGDVSASAEGPADRVPETALDEDAMFYLRSRGIPDLEARKLLALGFLAPALQRFPVEVYLELDRLITARLDERV